jgi:hypothetical protein
MKKTVMAMGLVLMFVALQAASGLASGTQAATGGVNDNALTGAWMVKGNTALQGDFNVLMTFHSDGTMSADESSAHETTGHGNWSHHGQQYEYTFISIIGSDTGAQSGWIKVVGTLGVGRSQWTGPFQVSVFDPDGNPIFADAGTFSANRIQIEQLK